MAHCVYYSMVQITCNMHVNRFSTKCHTQSTDWTEGSAFACSHVVAGIPIQKTQIKTPDC